MTKKIGITGVHASGKSILAKKLKERSEQSGKTVYLITEVARNCPYPLRTVEAQEYIWHNQMEQEKYAMRQDVDTIICDRTVMDNLMYYHAVLEDTIGTGELMGMWHKWGRLYDQAVVWMPTYRHIIRLPINLEWLKVDDPIRPKSVEFAIHIDRLFDQYVEKFVTNRSWV